VRCRWLDYGAPAIALQALLLWHFHCDLQEPKTPKKRGPPFKPPGEKLVRGTLYLPPEAWEKIEHAGRPALIVYIAHWRVKPPAG